jgi:hypothetical protein
MTEKEYKGFIILDWKEKNGKFRAVNRLPKKLKETEIPIQVSLKLKLPETPRLKVEGELELSGTVCKKLVLDALDSGEFQNE